MDAPAFKSILVEFKFDLIEAFIRASALNADEPSALRQKRDCNNDFKMLVLQSRSMRQIVISNVVRFPFND